MNNRELYKRSFDKLGPTEKFQKEIEIIMENEKNTKRMPLRRMLTLAAAVIMILSLAVAASAAGVFESVRLWINGQEVDPSGYVDENGDLVVDVEGEGRVDVLITDEQEAGEDADTCLVPDITAEYVDRDGAAILCFTNSDTGEVVELDITDELTDGRYQDTVTVFDCLCQVDLTANGETYSLSFSVEGFAE